jgi:hypothetical protein
VDIGVLKDLKRKSELFRNFEHTYLYLFSRSGFTSGLTKMAGEDNSVRLITLADLYNP